MSINIVLWSGICTGYDKGKYPKDSTWVCKAPVKEAEFDLECAPEALMEAKKSFVEASTSERKDKPKPEIDPSMLTTTLETYMKLICDNKAVKGLQELINR